MKSILLFVLLLASFVSKAQTPIGENKPLSWREKNFFHTIGVTAFLEVNRPPAGKYYQQRSQSNIPGDTVVNYEGTGAVTILSVTYDPRINIYHYRDFASLSVNLPVEFAISTYEPSGGFGTFVLPVFIDLNLFNHSTFNNIDRWGGHIGVGYQYIFGPLTKDYGGRRLGGMGWHTPVFRAGIKGPYKDHNCFIATTFCIPRELYDEYDNRKIKDKMYFKLVFGWILNYD
jgi:hypothetical protein